jgi:signal transduction histidine kinase/CheY-like chemotaxis protein
MKANPLRLAEERILVEQLRLLLGHIGSTLIPSFLLGLLLVLTLSNDSNTFALRTWGLTLFSAKLFATFHARRHLAMDIPFERARRLVWELIFLNMVDGFIWGALCWITLGTSTMAGSILVISTIAAMLGAGMSRLSPVLPVFIAFVSAMLTVATVKVWTLGDPAYNALGFASVLYLLSLSLMARNSSREIRQAINLRFENVELMEKLRVETGIAKEARLEAEQARNEAELANAAKSKFLAAASHDLRQPIHAQGLFLEVLARSELTAFQREVLTSANAASEASGEMLNTLLDFSRIEAGVVEPHVQTFRLQTLLNKIEREFESQADSKGLAYRSRETGLVVQSDPALIELILRNLVSNAIRYTDHGGLLVGCRRRGDFAILEVWDTGIGISPSHQQAVFREFHQLGNPERDRRKGLGLGLAIADGLARALEHRLSLVSTPRRGSVFRLSLPIATGQPTEEQGSTPGHDGMKMLNVRVLIIDDDETVRVGMLYLLRGWGCECEAAESIEEALDLARVHTPELVISDYRLREQRSGLEAIAALRGLFGADLPALLITGDTAPDRLREAQASGIPMLHKPVSPSQLYHGLVTVLPKSPDDWQ